MRRRQDMRRFLFCMLVATLIATPLGLAVQSMGWGPGAILTVMGAVCFAAMLYAFRDDLFHGVPPQQRALRRDHRAR